MLFQPATLLSALMVVAPLVQADFKINFYSDTSCQNYVKTFEGSNKDERGTYYDYNGHVGSMIIVSTDDNTDEVDFDDHCYWSAASCCRGAPDCSNGREGQGCLVVDKDVSKVWAGFTVCDVACFDAAYKEKRDVPFIA